MLCRRSTQCHVEESHRCHVEESRRMPCGRITQNVLCGSHTKTTSSHHKERPELRGAGCLLVSLETTLLEQIKLTLRIDAENQGERTQPKCILLCSEFLMGLFISHAFKGRSATDFSFTDYANESVPVGR